MLEVKARFDKYVNKTDGCWVWIGGISSAGYGRFHLNGGQHAHRVSYELHVGKIPKGLVLDHLCRNRACVNPSHLDPVSLVENIKRGDHYGKGWHRNVTHCSKGHEYTAENTYLVKRNSACGVGRVCKKCVQENRPSKRAKGVNKIVHL